MTTNTPPTQIQRDNLNIGIYLAGRRYGAQLEDILQAALGYNPNGQFPINSFERFEQRFRTAQAAGRDHLRTRVAGDFTFNAMPFGQYISTKSHGILGLIHKLEYARQCQWPVLTYNV